MTDPAAPYSFRNESVGGGVLLDLGSHIVSLARHLVGAYRRGGGGLGDRAQEPPGSGRPERRRDGGPRAFPGALRERRHRRFHRELGDAGAKDAARIRADRHTRLAGLQPGALQRAASLRHRRQARTRRLQDPALGPRHAALRQFLPGARPPAWLQRSEDDRGRASDQIDRRGKRPPARISAKPTRFSASSWRPSARAGSGAGCASRMSSTRAGVRRQSGRPT